MQRRQFLTTSIAASAAAVTGQLPAQTPAPQREYYQIRRYSLVSGPEGRLTQDYFAKALIPALTRLGLNPVGAFSLKYGPETPAYYLVIPGASVDLLVNIDSRLTADPDFVAAAEPYWKATAAAPAFQRIESWLLSAFEGWPRITPPPAVAGKAKRIYQLRTYESPSNYDHIQKVAMFHSGEFQIFQDSGCQQVFFGDTLIGSRMPSLTYMLSFTDMAELEAHWDTFFADPRWKKLNTDPRFTFDTIVTNVSNQILSPLNCSQV